MHRTLPPPTRISALKRRLESGFSLVEVTLSIGIIAVAFVALLGLLPVGMSTFRGSIDASNEMWIMQNFNSMVMTTDYKRVPELSYEKAPHVIYYFDEEGRRVDTSEHVSTDPQRVQARLYAVKLFVQDLARPDDESEKDIMDHGRRVMVVFAPAVNPVAMKQFDTLASPEPEAMRDAMKNLPKNTAVRIRSFAVARMDSER